MRRLRSAALDEDAIRQLFTAPPTEFVAARNELVKALRREKRRDEATAVAALRRPGWDDWALNVVATEHAPTVDAFTGAARDVREAQAAAIEGRDGPDVREAMKTLRDRSAELIALATDVLGRAGRQPGPGELNARLTEVAGSETAAAQLRAAILGSGDAAPDDVFADLEPAAAPRGDRSRRSSQQDDAADQRRLAAIAAATEKHDAATAALEQADAEVTVAEQALRQAEKELGAAQRKREKAAEAAERAANALDRIEA